MTDLVGGVIHASDDSSLTVRKDGLEYRLTGTWETSLPKVVQAEEGVRLTRAGLTWLLAQHPSANVFRLEDQGAEGPWVIVNLEDERRLTRCIWKNTGAVYALDDEGAVEDDPLFVP